ncbi:MAG: DNA gyrase/topoisomerase IV subunit A, partial [Bacteroidia bacterium]
KDLLIDPQGNWGDNRTGDRAAAARYIEARLSKFALDVAFNPKVTNWQISYDGRKREPVSLPMKFPMVLTQGVDGIAVGLSTKILPHNFVELVKASINVLKGKNIELFPDFPEGGMIDVSNYNGGKRGGKVRCRVAIEAADKTTLFIRDIPYGVTTTSMIDSIIKANDKGKIKIKKVVDNTAKDVEIQIDLPTGISPDVTIDALYAFTDCEVSISPNACIIIDDTPHFLTVEEILRLSTANTKEILRLELEIKLAELKEKLLYSSLERIFIENRIYRDIEECETWEAVIETIDKGLDPYKPQFYREITEEDIVRLTEIKIKRISRFDAFKADELIRNLETEIQEIEHNLAHLVEYAISYFEGILAKHGKDKERRAQIMNFETIQIRRVAVANEKLYVNRKEGFIGYSLKKDEYVKDCSDIDDVIIFRADGKYLVTRVSEKAFVGKDIIHVDVWKKNDERKVYHAVYRDPKEGKNYIKRFAVTAITRDREYDITKGNKSSKLIYFTAHPNSEEETITVYLTANCRAKKKEFDFDFGDLSIKGRSSQGNVLSKYPIRKIVQKEIGASTLGGRKIWYDETVGRINVEKRGQFLGEFDTEDLIIVFHRNGSYELTSFELTNRYDINKLMLIERFDPKKVYSAIHYEGKKKDYYVKRFQIETNKPGKEYCFISEESGSKLMLISNQAKPQVKYQVSAGGRKKEEVSIDLAEFIDVKGWKALGNRLDNRKVFTKFDEIIVKSEETENIQVGDSVEWEGKDLSKKDQGKLFE